MPWLDTILLSSNTFFILWYFCIFYLSSLQSCLYYTVKITCRFTAVQLTWPHMYAHSYKPIARSTTKLIVGNILTVTPAPFTSEYVRTCMRSTWKPLSLLYFWLYLLNTNDFIQATTILSKYIWNSKHVTCEKDKSYRYDH